MGPSASPAFAPSPEAAIPTEPAALASALARVTEALDASAGAWVAAGLGGGAPATLTLQALYQQRIYRALAADAALAAATIARLPAEMREDARATVDAAARLRSLLHPVAHPSGFHTGPADPAGELLADYRAAERRFGVPWQVLAAVNFVESKFGRVRSASYAGAQGPMQFLLATWHEYGLGGDVHDAHDAIMGAANYLHASGAPADVRRALHAYNPSDAYVDAVLDYAGRMEHDERWFAVYHEWQVFVATTSGDRRLTGPGL